MNHLQIYESFIEEESEVINFNKKINLTHYHKQRYHEHSIYLHMVMERNKEKKVYILSQNLNIFYEKNQQILKLSNFFTKPYNNLDRPEYFKDAHFNNYRPFQTLVELNNSSVEIFHKDLSGVRSIILNVSMIYNLEKTGDPIRGPGRNLTECDIAFEIFYFSEPRGTKIPLSNMLRLIW
jgi:hypothetical protein